jgi:hypothetical protein
VLIGASKRPQRSNTVGVATYSPGLPYSLPWVTAMRGTNPNGVAAREATTYLIVVIIETRAATPLGLETMASR